MPDPTATLDELLSPLREEPSRAAVLLDVDGVLAPIVAHPDDAHMPETTRRPLIEVAKRYGVVAFDAQGQARAIIEKPKEPPSSYAVTGLYFLDGTAPERARAVRPSERGELEITTLLESYLQEGRLTVKTMGRGYAWLDTGTFDSLLDASDYVRTIERRQGLKIGVPEEVAWRLGFIDDDQLAARARSLVQSGYGAYLLELLEQ